MQRKTQVVLSSKLSARYSNLKSELDCKLLCKGKRYFFIVVEARVLAHDLSTCFSFRFATYHQQTLVQFCYSRLVSVAIYNFLFAQGVYSVTSQV